MAQAIYSWEEISKHNTKDDLWLVVDNKVYNLTSFVASHPGGEQPLLHYAGKDATKKFKSIPEHMADEEIPAFLETLCIGTVAL